MNPAAGENVGSAFVTIRAVVKNARKDIIEGFREGFREGRKEAERAGDDSGKRYSESFNRSTRNRIKPDHSSAKKDAEKAGSEAGDRFGTAFARTALRGLKLVSTSLKGIAVLATAAMAALGGQAALGGLAAIITSLSQISGLLALIPAGMGGLLATVATIKIGISGVGDAFKAMGEAGKNAEQNAKAVAAAQKGVAQAQKGVQDANEGVQTAIEGVTDAEKNAKRATEDKKDAVDALNDAYRTAKERLEDLDLQIKGAALSEEGAVLRVKRARERLANMPKDSTALDYEEANLSLREAQHNLDEVRESNGDLREEYAKSKKEGVEGSDEVVQAKKRVADATDAEKEAQQGVAKAQKEVVKAQERVVEAQQALAEAIEAVNEAAKSTSVDKFQEALSKLSPAAAGFVLAMKDLKPAWDEVKNAVQDNLFKNLGADVTSLANRYLPILKVGLGGIATSLNGIARDVIGAFNTPKNAQIFETLMSRTANLLNKIRPGITSIVNAFGNLINVGSEFFGRFGDGFNNLAQRFENWTSNTGHMRDIINTAIEQTKKWMGAIGALGGTLMHIGKIASESGLTDSFLGLFHTLEDVTKSAEGTKALQEFFRNAADAANALAPILKEVMLGLADIGSILAGLGAKIAPGVLDFIKGLRDAINELRPGIDAVAPKISELFSAIGGQGSNIGQAINALIEAFGPWIDIMRVLTITLLPVFAKTVEFLAPVLSALAPAIVGVALAWKAFKIAEAGSNAVMRVSTLLIGKQAAEAKKKGIVTRALSGTMGLFGKSEKGAAEATKKTTVAMKLKSAATKVAGVAMKGLGAAMTFMTGPIGIIIGIIALLVGGLILLYKKNEGFRNFVNKAWASIKEKFVQFWNTVKPILTELWENIKRGWEVIFPKLKAAAEFVFNALGKAISLYWNYYAKPILTALKWLIMNVVVPAIVWLWKNVVEPAFKAMGAIISWTWNNIIKPAWDALVWTIQNVMIPIIKFLWDNVVRPIWNLISNLIKWSWENVIKPAWDNMTRGLEVLGKFFSDTWNNVIKPIWNALGNGIRWVIDNIIKPAFDFLKDRLDDVKRFFGNTVDGVKNLWNGIKKVVADPINFVIREVWNGGIAKLWNKVASVVGIDKKLDEHVPEVKFAKGGYVTGGTPNKDSVRALLMPGEVVMNKRAVKALGKDNLLTFNQMALSGHPVSSEGMLPNTKADMRKRVNSPVPGMARGGSYEEAMKKAHEWARAQNNKPYLTGNQFPAGADCSGFMSALAGVILGQGEKAHWSTVAFPAGQAASVNAAGQNWVKGLGKGFSIGMSGGPASGGQNGHTAGTLTGIAGFPTVNVESGGSHGNIAYGGPAAGADNGQFSTQYHLPIIEGAFETGGQGGDGGGFFSRIIETIKSKVIKIFTEPLRALVRGIPNQVGPGPVGQIPRKLAENLADKAIKYIEDKAGAKDKLSGAAGNFGGKVVGGAGSVPLIQNPDGTWTSPSPAWAHLIQRESGGNPNVVQNGYVDANTGGNEASGLFQIAKGTWAGYGGTEFAPEAGQASPQQQATVAARIFNAEGGSPWGAGLEGRENEEELRAGLRKYDAGGWLKPGTTRAINKTRKPEAVLTARQWAAVEKTAKNQEDQNKEDEKAESAEEEKRKAEEEKKQVEDEAKAKQQEYENKLKEARKTPNTENRRIRGIKPGMLDWDAADYMAKTTWPNQARDYAKDAAKSIAGEFLDPVGLTGLAGMGIDKLFEIYGPKEQSGSGYTNGGGVDESQQQYAPSGIGADANKVADQINFYGMEPKKVMEEIRRAQNKRNAYTSRYTNG